MTGLVLVLSAALAVSVACSTVCVVAVILAHAAVVRASTVLLRGEEHFADRVALALHDGDTVAELAAMRTVNSLIHARSRLEDRYGRR